VNALPSKEELLAFQTRWMRRAGLLAILGALLFAVSLPLQSAGTGDNDAERLTKFHEHSTQLIFAQGVLVGIPFLLFTALLYVLIKSAAGRTERIGRVLVWFAFIGPVLFALSSFLLAAGLNDVSGKFVDQVPPQAASGARDDLANKLIDDSGLLQAGSVLRLVGFISLVFALIYIPLWSMRTGLLTRFWATLGMAFGVSLLLVPFGIIGLVLWFAAVGLMLAGWWPRPLPPAWAAGEAIPWPRPGEDIGPPPEAPGQSGTVEGSGREISEPSLPEDREPAEEPQDAPGQPGETRDQRRRKRKRRT
jgi:hypothetical protein